MATPQTHPIFGTQCAPVIGSTFDTCGGSFSRAQLTTLDAAGIRLLFTDGTKFHENAFVLKHQFEMNMCGIKKNGFYEWLMSSGRNGMGKLLTYERRDKGPMLLRPFITGRQQSVVNADYYTITGGFTTERGSTGTGTSVQYPTAGPLDPLVIPATGFSTVADRVIRVVNGYGAGQLLDAGRFLSDMSATVLGGHALYVLNASAGGVAFTTQWRIVSAANDPAGLFVDVALKFAGDTTPTNKDLTPVVGVVINGVNNVHDVEQYCKNPSNYTNIKFVPFWFQTYRDTRCVDSEYLKVQKQLLQSNDYYDMFVNLPEAERNRQDEERSQREFIHSFLFGRALNSNQNVTLWGSLPDITSVGQGSVLNPGVGSKLITKRANMIGVYDQLRSCGSGTGQVKDLQGATLDMELFLENWVYSVHRARQSRGSKHARHIVFFTDIGTINEFNAAWIKYSMKKTGITTSSVVFNASEMDANDPKAQLGFTWRQYTLFKPGGVTLELVAHETFDDLRDMGSSADPTHPHRSRYLLGLDLGAGGTIYAATLASNRKVYTVGEIEQLARLDSTFSCVMEAPTLVKTLTSRTVTAVVECPLESLWIENFSGFVVTP